MRNLLFGLAVTVAATAAWGQSPAAPGQAAKPQFDVVSIHAAPSIQQVIASHQVPHTGTRIDAGRVDIGFASLRDLICAAYKVKPYQVSGPAYLTTQRFDILATIPEGVSKEDVPVMLQAMLASRFGLTFHRVEKDLPVYAMVAAQDGVKLTPSASDAETKAEATAQAESKTAGAQTLDGGNGGKFTVSRSAGNSANVTVTGGANGPMQMEMGPDGMQLTAARLSMTALADMLTGLSDHPVLDQTGLTGTYQVSIAVSQSDLMALARAKMTELGLPVPPQLASQASAPSGGSILRAVQKLGLRLDPIKAPVATIVVDHMDQSPTAN